MSAKIITPIYLISGWGFCGDVFNCSTFSCFNYSALDYFNLPSLSLDSVSERLSNFISESSIIVGWSLGGLLATNIAYLFPAKVKKLVLVASQPKFLEDDLWSGISKKEADHFLQYATKNFDALLVRFLSLVNYPNCYLGHKNHLVRNMITTEKYALIKFLEMMFKTDLRREYQSINKKILHIVGNKDAIINQDGFSFKKLNVNAQTVVVDQAGHAGFLTHSKIYQNILKDFINNV